ncbi:MAG: glycoside hydrolase family 32 protein [Ruminococcus sp.]|nr:glycoside hydrolase family 32 protein [Ruminococcus sp.]
MKNDLRQQLHLEPQNGWLNDPNGLCFFKGRYHVYFQYAPSSADGSGKKCWGHFQSRDLISWEFTGTVLFPDSPDDADGVFSGSAVVKGDTLYLFYTGNVEQQGDFDLITAGRGANTILVTTKDGVTMSEKKVVLRNSDYPGYCSCHVRDPKVWEQDGRYRMVLGARTLDDKGCVLFYRSDDLINWEFEEEVRTLNMGYMWECPDCFELGGKEYLGFSPQGLAHEKYRFQNVYSSGYLQMATGVFTEWDNGFDFYAPQSFIAPDGRRILIGWMGIGDIPYTNPTAALGWQHCLTVPCELTLGGDGKLLRDPVAEIDSLVTHRQVLAGGEGESQLPFDLTAQAVQDSFELTLGGAVRMKFDGGIFTLRFVDERVGCGRDVRRARLECCKSIRVLADKTSLEIFLNGGEKVLSTRFYPSDTRISIRSKGLSCEVSQLDAMQVRYLGE